MKSPSPVREAPRPSLDLGALRSTKSKPLTQSQIESQILAWLKLGPMTPGEIVWKCFDGSIKAAARDKALAALLDRKLIAAAKVRFDRPRFSRELNVVELTRRPGGEP